MKNYIFITFFVGLFHISNSQTICLDTGTDSAQYTITFQSFWNTTDHTSIPSNAHWSNLVSVIHNSPNQFLELGQYASLGIKNVAELGDNTAIINEIQSEIDNENAVGYSIQAFDPNNATSSITFDVNICDTHPYITLISMIAPSPDWFIAINSLDFTNDTLIEGIGFWKENIVVDVFAYDAGTDNGIDYDSPNSPNTAIGISMITGFPFNGNKIGSLSVVLKGILLGTNKNESLDVFNIYPNPNKTGQIRITNTTNINSIDIYDPVGKKVKSNVINSSKSETIIAINAVKKGIYIVKLKTATGHTYNRKLIVN